MNKWLLISTCIYCGFVIFGIWLNYTYPATNINNEIIDQNTYATLVIIGAVVLYFPLVYFPYRISKWIFDRKQRTIKSLN